MRREADDGWQSEVTMVETTWTLESLESTTHISHHFLPMVLLTIIAWISITSFIIKLMRNEKE
jgi:hypothetical protein